MKKYKDTCWDFIGCCAEMNRFYDANRNNPDTNLHFIVFSTLLQLTDERGSDMLDMGCGTGILSEYCKDFNYRGADLPHIISGCSMRNYPQYYYRAANIVADDISWIREFPVIAMSAVIDVMEDPLLSLGRILESAAKYVIIHRQEITEEGETHAILAPAYNGQTWHSIIRRSDLMRLLEEHNFYIVKELPLHYTNWENNGSSFLLRKRRSWSLYNIDHKLNALFRDRPTGFFIEAGANDGINQSNSYYFEHYHNWKGLLVEPIEELYRNCLLQRSSNTIIENYALVGPGHPSPTIEIVYTPGCHGLMSVIDGPGSDAHLAKAQEQGVMRMVPAITLGALLEKHNITSADLLILDVEGYEMEVIRGIDFEKCRIEYLLIEELEGRDELGNYLDKWYGRISRLTHHDYLYKRR